MSEADATGRIPLSVPEISGREWQYVKECLDGGWVSSVGAYVTRFEDMLAAHVGSKHAVAVVNGTSALHVSLLCSGVGPEDEVIVPSITFIAPVNAVRYCGAHPVFVDCVPETLCMDVDMVADFVGGSCEVRDDGFSYNIKTGRKVRAAIPVHVFGHPTDMGPLVEVCNKNNVRVIEDATESLGSEYKGRKTGAIGDMGCFSFNGNKIITSGGGGMVVTDDEAVAKKVRHLTTQAKCDPIEYDHDEVGYNYRLTNIQAAVGVAQLERIEEFVGIKRENARLYAELFSGTEEVEFLGEMPWAKSNRWFYTIRVPAERKASLVEHLLSSGIDVRPLWKPIHSLPMYADCERVGVSNAEEAYARCINLPCSVGLNKSQIERVVETVKVFFKG